LLPDLPTVPGAAFFDDRIRLLKAGYPKQAPSDGVLPVTLAWQTTGPLPSDVHLSLRLVAEDGTRAAQADEALVSGWLAPLAPHAGLAADTLPAGQALLSFHRFKLPAGMLPGEYRLQAALFQPQGDEWPLQDGQLALDLGQVKVAFAERPRPVDPWGEYKPVRNATFGGEIGLVGYDYSVTRAGQGKGFAAQFLWQATRRPAVDYTLLVELVDANGKVWRDWRHVPADGRVPTSTWAPGQTVRDQIDLVIPAGAPPGDSTLRVKLSWLRPDGTRLPVRRWLLPVGDGLSLPGVRIEEKEDRRFEPPPIPQAASANFDDKVQLIGYDLPVTRLSAGDSLPVTLFWRSLSSDMRESYTVFVHLVGPDGTIYGQWDKEPGERSKQPTTGWVAGEIVIDPIPVPLSPGAPPGTYRVLVGLYLAPEGPRLPLRGDSGRVASDTFELTHVQVGN
jgi:hypothetical protein